MYIIMDIKEAAEKMTKDEFLKSAKETCIKRYGINVANEDCQGIKCEDCRKEQIKGIKFKNDVEETFEVECIDAKNRKELTKGQIYLAKQSEYYTDYYEIDGHTYKKERFKMVEKPVSEIIEGLKEHITNDFKECEQSFNNYLEGEKVEEVIKVRCIDAKGCSKLNLYKIYVVRYETNESYVLEEIGEGYEFDKDRFEKVTDDVLMVECIDNQQGLNGLIIGRTYKVIKEDDRQYKVLNECDEEVWCNKSRFKLAEPQKEEKEKYYVLDKKGKEVIVDKGEIIKEYTFKELIANIKPNEEYICQEFKVRCLETGTIQIEGRSGHGVGFYVSDLFTKVEEPKPVTTSEAMKALEEGKIIESVVTKYKYKKVKDKIMIETDVTRQEKRGFVKFSYLNITEIEGKWIILE